MKTAVFLYNPESGKGKIARNVGCISTIFQAYGYDVTPQRIDFTANPFDGNETIDLMVVAGGDAPGGGSCGERQQCADASYQ